MIVIVADNVDAVGGGGGTVDTTTLAKETTLANILTQVTGMAMGGSTSANQLSVINLLNDINTILNTDPTSGANQTTIINLLTDIATEATLKSVETILSNIDTNTTGQAVSPNFNKSTTSGTLTGAIKATITNTGSADGTVLGTILQPDETVAFSIDHLNRKLDDIAYDASGTEFTIVTLT